MKKLFISVLTAAVVSSCGTTSNISKVGTAQMSISGTEWELADSVKGTTPTLKIESGRISGNSGCNSYFTNDFMLDSTAGNFSAKNIASTKMACDNMTVENNFMQMLQQANKYVVAGDVLELYRNDLLLMKLRKK